MIYFRLTPYGIAIIRILHDCMDASQTRSLPTEAFTWWKVDRADPNSNKGELLAHWRRWERHVKPLE